MELYKNSVVFANVELESTAVALSADGSEVLFVLVAFVELLASGMELLLAEVVVLSEVEFESADGRELLFVLVAFVEL